MKPLFSVRELRSGYAGGVVLGGVDLDLDAGGIVAVLGRNGVGKTTLISTVMGLVRRTGAASPSTAGSSPEPAST